MKLTDIINEDIKKAMLAREKDKLEALRAIKAALLIEKTSEKTSGISDEVEIKLLQKLVKQRKESAEIYKSQNRTDLASNEIFQAEIISQYLPKQLDTNEIKAIISEIIQQTEAKSIKDMGKVMALATKNLAGKADNKAISIVIKELLNTNE